MLQGVAENARNLRVKAEDAPGIVPLGSNRGLGLALSPSDVQLSMKDLSSTAFPRMSAHTGADGIVAATRASLIEAENVLSWAGEELSWMSKAEVASKLADPSLDKEA